MMTLPDSATDQTHDCGKSSPGFALEIVSRLGFVRLSRCKDGGEQGREQNLQDSGLNLVQGRAVRARGGIVYDQGRGSSGLALPTWSLLRAVMSDQQAVDAVLKVYYEPHPRRSRQRRGWRRAFRWLMLGGSGVIGCWIFAAYVLLPWLWKHYEHQPGLANAPKFSVTGAGIPGDPLNLGLVGTQAEVVHAMLGSGWTPADAITWRTSLGIARSVLEHRPDPTAPVSNLYVFGHKQDLAFEKAATAGGSASQRHHVRFWRADDLGQGGVPFWLGAATFDRSVGFSHLTAQITHHIAADIDSERNDVINGLAKAGWLTQEYQVTGVGATLLGRNGGGDRYDTDGELTIGVLASSANPQHNDNPASLDNPTPVAIKDQLWAVIRPLLRSLPDSSVPSDN